MDQSTLQRRIRASASASSASTAITKGIRTSEASSSRLSSVRYSYGSAGGSAVGSATVQPSVSLAELRRQALVAQIIKIVSSPQWNILVLFFIFIVIFLPIFQGLWASKSVDVLFDIIYALSILVLGSDIFFRCVADPHHWKWRVTTPFKRRPFSKLKCVIPGTFPFWVDLLSTFTPVFEFSTVNADMKEVHIELNAFGVPVSGISAKGVFVSKSEIIELLLITLRVGLLDRFIKSVSKSSQNINWYRIFFRYLNPVHHYKMYKLSTSKHSATAATGVEKKTVYHGIELEGGITRCEAAMVIQHWWKSLIEEGVVVIGSEAKSDHKDSNYSLKKTIYKKMSKNIVSKTIHAAASPNATDSTLDDPTYKSNGDKTEKSRVGLFMKTLTGQRVAQGVLIFLVTTVLFTYVEPNVTTSHAMVLLHNQTQNERYARLAVSSARKQVIPSLYSYELVNGTVWNYTLDYDPMSLRDRERMLITVANTSNLQTRGYFTLKEEVFYDNLSSLMSAIFIIILWYMSVVAFNGPVLTLVVVPIERMIKLLGMLMKDPLGYQASIKFRKFVKDEDKLTEDTGWTKEILKGMETSFLMSTIVRIGSLLKVGFGSAGVDIIRNSLERGGHSNSLFLDTRGSTVKCIFVFCDIRQFTDATECLQEEVFVFTNKVANIVHSISSAYGGSANKNVGDAFLMSWLVEEPEMALGGSRNRKSLSRRSLIPGEKGRMPRAALRFSSIGQLIVQSLKNPENVHKTHADRALLAVIKILCSLYHDQYILEALGEVAKNRLLEKLADRPGPVVQMGFGLHFGEAVVGAIGSARKIDATYLSENVELAEFLESNTKRYGLKLLMSDEFHGLLHSSNKRRCRKIDQVRVDDEDLDDPDEPTDLSMLMIMELYTYDLDIEALWNKPKPKRDQEEKGEKSELKKSGSTREVIRKRASVFFGQQPKQGQKSGTTPTSVVSAAAAVAASIGSTSDKNEKNKEAGGGGQPSPGKEQDPTNIDDEKKEEEEHDATPKLVLPTGPVTYNLNDWVSKDMVTMRKKYMDYPFYPTFSSGLTSFYAKDWDHAKQCFQNILERFEDGPSKYFLKKIEANHGVPPRNFKPYNSD